MNTHVNIVHSESISVHMYDGYCLVNLNITKRFGLTSSC